MKVLITAPVKRPIISEVLNFCSYAEQFPRFSKKNRIRYTMAQTKITMVLTKLKKMRMTNVVMKTKKMIP